MIDREKVLAVLHKRFPGAGADQVAAAKQLIREHSAPQVDAGFKRATVFVLNVERAEPV